MGNPTWLDRFVGNNLFEFLILLPIGIGLTLGFHFAPSINGATRAARMPHCGSAPIDNPAPIDGGQR